MEAGGALAAHLLPANEILFPNEMCLPSKRPRWAAPCTTILRFVVAMPRENMALSPEDVPGSSVATRESALRSIALCAWLVVDGERSRERDRPDKIR